MSLTKWLLVVLGSIGATTVIILLAGAVAPAAAQPCTREAYAELVAPVYAERRLSWVCAAKITT